MPLYRVKRLWPWHPSGLRSEFQGLAQGLRALFPLWEGSGPAINLVDRFQLTRQAGTDYAIGPIGANSRRLAGTSDHFTGPATYQPINLDGNHTWFGVSNASGVLANTSNGAGMLIGQRVGAGGSFAQGGIYLNIDGDGNPIAGAFSPFYHNLAGNDTVVEELAVVNGSWQSFAARRSGTTITGWRNGVQTLSSTLGASGYANSGQLLSIGGLGVAAYGIVGDIAIAAGWNRALSDFELDLLHDNWTALLEQAPSFTGWLAASTSLPVTLGPAPVWQVSGTLVAATTTSVAVNYPAGYQANDIAVLQVHGDNAAVLSVPAGWTPMGAQVNSTTVFGARLWWRRLVGNEAALIGNVTTATAALIVAQCHIFRGVNPLAATPFEGYGAVASTVVTVAGVAITTTGINRLGVLFRSIGDDLPSNPATGYTERVDAGTTTGSDGEIVVEDRVIATAQTVVAATRTISAANPAITFGLAFLPAPVTSVVTSRAATDRIFFTEQAQKSRDSRVLERVFFRDVERRLRSSARIALDRLLLRDGETLSRRRSVRQLDLVLLDDRGRRVLASLALDRVLLREAVRKSRSFFRTDGVLVRDQAPALRTAKRLSARDLLLLGDRVTASRFVVASRSVVDRLLVGDSRRSARVLASILERLGLPDRVLRAAALTRLDNVPLRDAQRSTVGLRRRDASLMLDQRSSARGLRRRDEALLLSLRRSARALGSQDRLLARDARRSARSAAQRDRLLAADSLRQARGLVRRDATLLADRLELGQALTRARRDDLLLADGRGSSSVGLRVAEGFLLVDQVFAGTSLTGELFTRSFVDELLLDDGIAVGRALGRAALDHLALPDWGLRAVAIGRRDAILTGDLPPVRALGLSLLDHLPVDDRAKTSLALSRSLLDFVLLEDRAASARSRVVAALDRLGLAERLDRVQRSTRVFLDNLPLIDRNLSVGGLELIFRDDLGLADRAVNLRATTLDLLDSVLLEDEEVRTRRSVLALLDRLGMADRLLLARSLARAAVDRLALRDQGRANRGQALAFLDRLGLRDLIETSRSLRALEGVELGDRTAPVALRDLLARDGIQLVDEVRAGRQKVLLVNARDGMLLAEASRKDHRRVIVNGVELADAAARSTAFVLADRLAILDRRSLGRAISQVDRIVAIDATARGRGIAARDTIVLPDSETRSLWKLLRDMLAESDRHATVYAAFGVGQRNLEAIRARVVDPMPRRADSLTLAITARASHFGVALCDTVPGLGDSVVAKVPLAAIIRTRRWSTTA